MSFTTERKMNSQCSKDAYYGDPVPVAGRESLMEELHEAHPGMVKMKSGSQLLLVASVTFQYFIENLA